MVLKLNVTYDLGELKSVSKILSEKSLLYQSMQLVLNLICVPVVLYTS